MRRQPREFTLTDEERNLVAALCRNDLNQAATGREMHYHANTIRYKIKQITEKTGHDPTTFFGALELLMWETLK